MLRDDMRSLLQGYVSYFTTRLRANIPGYFFEFWPWLLLTTFAATADFVSTYRFMSAGYLEDEFHPVIRLVSRWFGPLMGPLIGKLGQLAAILFVTIVFRPRARLVFIPVILIYAYAAWFNTWGIHLYTPVFIRLFS